MIKIRKEEGWVYKFDELLQVSSGTMIGGMVTGKNNIPQFTFSLQA
jgi:hypothetical protein